jgi:hypothetical protein
LHCKIRRETEQSGAIGARMTKGLLSGGHHRPARQRRYGDRGIVNYAAKGHIDCKFIV